MTRYSSAERLTRCVAFLAALGTACSGSPSTPGDNPGGGQPTGNQPGTCPTPVVLQKNTSVSGTIKSTCIIGGVGTEPYRFTVTGFENDRLIVTSGIATFELFDDAGHTVAVAGKVPNQSAVALVLLAAGSYNVRVQGAVGTSFTLQFDDGHSPIVGCPVMFTATGADFDGTVDPLHCSDNATISAGYAAWVGLGGSLTITARDRSADASDTGTIVLLGPDGTLLSTATFDPNRRTYSLSYRNAATAGFHVLIMTTRSTGWTYHVTRLP